MQKQYSGYNSYSSSYLPLETPVDGVSDHLLAEQANLFSSCFIHHVTKNTLKWIFKFAFINI